MISDSTILNQGKSSHLIHYMSHVQPARSHDIISASKATCCFKSFEGFFCYFVVFLPKVHPSLKLFGSNFEDAEQNGRRPFLEKCNVREHIWCVGLDWIRHFVSPWLVTYSSSTARVVLWHTPLLVNIFRVSTFGFSTHTHSLSLVEGKLEFLNKLIEMLIDVFYCCVVITIVVVFNNLNAPLSLYMLGTLVHC